MSFAIVGAFVVYALAVWVTVSSGASNRDAQRAATVAAAEVVSGAASPVALAPTKDPITKNSARPDR